MNDKTIWTIGHSTRSFEEFVTMLQSFGIEAIADVRNYPGSKKFPQYNKDTLQVSLPQQGIQYVHLKSLGGRRKAKPDSKNNAWRSAAFRGYADYMETADFKEGVAALERMAAEQRTAYMCSEAVWWRCHRSLISDYVKLHGWTVLHILNTGKAEEHPYTSPARIINGALDYGTEGGGT